MRCRSKTLLACSFACLVPDPALAQRANENALRSAEDAFGSSIGNESIGLYSPYDVRGFSPFSAGNVRLEGLYYDAVAGFNGRLIRGSTVRVGISAQGYPFPAPTGIADFRLRIPDGKRALSVVAGGDTWGSVYTQVDGKLPIAPGVALALGAHASHDKYRFDGGGNHASAAAILSLHPIDGLEITPFWSVYRHFGMDGSPILLTQGDFLPERFERGRYFSQPWARYKGFDSNFGSVAKWRHGKTEVAAGIFRSVSTISQTFTELFTLNARDSLQADHLVSAAQDQKFASTSGEIRASQDIASGAVDHEFTLSVRARNRTRRYGGDDTLDLGPTEIPDTVPIAKPSFEFGSFSHDRVRQRSLGIGYQGRWKGVGELSLGIQKVDYRKDATRPDRTVSPTHSTPWLYSGGLAFNVARGVAAYASYTRGLEESPVAPTYAVNRDEAPSAILTRQYDAGIRWNVSGKVKLVAGVFNVEKPYFSVDSQLQFRQVGQIRKRGLELSIAGQLTPRLNIVAGAILLDATASGDDVLSGRIGKRPVGSVPRTLLISGDYQLPWIDGLSVDAAINSYGRQPANAANSLFVPASTTVGLGLRYTTRVAARNVSVRLGGTNLFDTYSWDVFGSNAFFYSGAREFTLRTTIDI